MKTRNQRRKDRRDDFCAVCAIILVFSLFLLANKIDALYVAKTVRSEVCETESVEMPAIECSAMTDEEIEAWHRFADCYSSEVPLSDDEQQSLFNACEEFGIDYYLMLGLIQKETQFRNVVGDSGDSIGYCQVQPQWWSGLMHDIGATDLNNAEDNFRTSCAILSQLFEKYGCGNLEDVLTAYNSGHGGSSSYADDVIAFQEAWSK